MGAKSILLTHFSQRYPKFPDLSLTPLVDDTADPTVETTGKPPVTIAFDCASFRIGSLWKMEHYMGALTKTFPPEEDAGPSEGDLLAGEPEPTPSSPGKKGKGKSKGGVQA